MKIWQIVIFAGLILALIACSQSTDEEIYYEIQEMLNTINSYQCIAKIKIICQEGETEYIFQQSYKAPNKYRLEVLSPQALEGNLTLYNGKTAWFKNPSINQIWKIDNFHQSQEQLMFLGYFLKNYISSKESNFETESLGSENYIIFETSIPGGNHYFDKQKLWVNKKNRLPEKLYIYDESGRVGFKVYYENFIYNLDMEEEFFYLLDKEL